MLTTENTTTRILFLSYRSAIFLRHEIQLEMPILKQKAEKFWFKMHHQTCVSVWTFILLCRSDFLLFSIFWWPCFQSIVGMLARIQWQKIKRSNIIPRCAHSLLTSGNVEKSLEINEELHPMTFQFLVETWWSSFIVCNSPPCHVRQVIWFLSQSY